MGSFFVFEGGDHIEDAISSFIPCGRLYAALLRGETDSSLQSASPTGHRDLGPHWAGVHSGGSAVRPWTLARSRLYFFFRW